MEELFGSPSPAQQQALLNTPETTIQDQASPEEE
jgi:hypothetical protein